MASDRVWKLHEDYQPLPTCKKDGIVVGSSGVTIDQRVLYAYGKALGPLEKERGGISNDHENNAWLLGKEEGTNGISVAPEAEGQNRIVINVSGMRYETYKSTLAILPDSLLGSTTKRAPYYRPTNNELCFKRNREAFDSILFYYQSGGKDGGILVKPDGIPDETFAAEVMFFELGEEAERIIDLAPDTSHAGFEGVSSGLMSKIASLFEPGRTQHSSPLHRLIDVWTIIITVFFVTLLCVKTLLSIKETFTVNQRCNQTNANAAPKPRDMSFFWSFSEKTCVSWFTLEYVFRTLSATHRTVYLLSEQGIFDMLSFLPYAIKIVLQEVLSETDMLFLPQVLNLLTFFSMFKLTRYSVGLQIVFKTIQTSVKELVLFLLCVSISLILFSSVIYHCESNEQSTMFTSIPATFWFVIVTMTTVGYGDMTPTTAAGKIFSALCALFGVCCVLAIPSTVIVSNFNFYYLKQKTKQKKAKRVKNRISGLLEWVNRFRTVSL